MYHTINITRNPHNSIGLDTDTRASGRVVRHGEARPKIHARLNSGWFQPCAEIWDSATVRTKAG